MLCPPWLSGRAELFGPGGSSSGTKSFRAESRLPSGAGKGAWSRERSAATKSDGDAERWRPRLKRLLSTSSLAAAAKLSVHRSSCDSKCWLQCAPGIEPAGLGFPPWQSQLRSCFQLRFVRSFWKLAVLLALPRDASRISPPTKLTVSLNRRISHRTSSVLQPSKPLIRGRRCPHHT